MPSGSPAFILPVSTLIFRSHGLQVATVAANNRAELKDITLGRDLGNEVEVVSGISAADSVIETPPDSLVTGETVRVVARQVFRNMSRPEILRNEWGPASRRIQTSGSFESKGGRAMKRFYQITLIALGLVTLLFVVAQSEHAIGQQFARPPEHAVDPNAKPGTPGVFTDFKGEAPGNVHHITAADLPGPYATKSSAVFSRPVPRPADAWPQAPAGFKVTLYAEKLADPPRTIITAPNGDFFVASTNKGTILVFHGMTADGKPENT